METRKVRPNPPPPKNVHLGLFSRMNQAPVQGFEMDMGNKTTIHSMYPKIACTEDPGTQVLLPVNLSGLKWFMKVMQKQDNVWKPRNPGYVDEGAIVVGDRGDSREKLAGYWGTPRAYLSLEAVVSNDSEAPPP